jgi:hypothetical protein
MEASKMIVSSRTLILEKSNSRLLCSHINRWPLINKINKKDRSLFFHIIRNKKLDITCNFILAVGG